MGNPICEKCNNEIKKVIVTTDKSVRLVNIVHHIDIDFDSVPSDEKVLAVNCQYCNDDCWGTFAFE